MKKTNLIAMLLCVATMTSMWSCNSKGSAPTSSERSNNNETANRKEELMNTARRLAGTYRFTDNTNNNFDIVLNTDATAIVTLHQDTYVTHTNGVRQHVGDESYYGNWDFNSREEIALFMSDPFAPYFHDGYQWLYNPIISDGYLYTDLQAMNAKNLNKRIRITKTK